LGGANFGGKAAGPSRKISRRRLPPPETAGASLPESQVPALTLPGDPPAFPGGSLKSPNPCGREGGKPEAPFGEAAGAGQDFFGSLAFGRVAPAPSAKIRRRLHPQPERAGACLPETQGPALTLPGDPPAFPGGSLKSPHPCGREGGKPEAPFGEAAGAGQDFFGRLAFGREAPAPSVKIRRRLPPSQKGGSLSVSITRPCLNILRGSLAFPGGSPKTPPSLGSEGRQTEAACGEGGQGVFGSLGGAAFEWAAAGPSRKISRRRLPPPEMAGASLPGPQGPALALRGDPPPFPSVFLETPPSLGSEGGQPEPTFKEEGQGVFGSLGGAAFEWWQPAPPKKSAGGASPDQEGGSLFIRGFSESAFHMAAPAPRWFLAGGPLGARGKARISLGLAARLSLPKGAERVRIRAVS
jgi:hypothetical protein